MELKGTKKKVASQLLIISETCWNKTEGLEWKYTQCSQTNDIKSCLQKCWAEPLFKSRWYDEKPGHMRHWQSPLAPQRSFQIRSLPITWVTQESTNAAEKPWKIDIKPKKWKFGSDEFPFQLGGFLGSSAGTFILRKKIWHFQPFWIQYWGIFPRINFLHLLNDINTIVAAQVDQKASTRYAQIWHTTKRNQKPKYESQITQIMQQKSVTAPPEKHLMYILAQTWWMAIESIFVTVNLPPPNVPPSETRVYLIRPY